MFTHSQTFVYNPPPPNFKFLEITLMESNIPSSSAPSVKDGNYKEKHGTIIYLQQASVCSLHSKPIGSLGYSNRAKT